MINLPLLLKKNVFTDTVSVRKNNVLEPPKDSKGLGATFLNSYVLTFVLLFCFAFSGYGQKEKDVLPLVCVKKMENGLYQASFSYENPTRKEVVIDENGSIIKSNNGKRVAKGLNKFQPGVNKKAFTKEFGAGDFVEWTITDRKSVV